MKYFYLILISLLLYGCETNLNFSKLKICSNHFEVDAEPLSIHIVKFKYNKLTKVIYIKGFVTANVDTTTRMSYVTIILNKDYKQFDTINVTNENGEFVFKDKHLTKKDFICFYKYGYRFYCYYIGQLRLNKKNIIENPCNGLK